MLPARYTKLMVRIFRRIPAERLKLLVFDLDGTLIDSAQDLCNSVNAALQSWPRPAARPCDCRLCRQRRAHADAPVAGPGRQHCPRPGRRGLFAKAYDFFLQYYREHKLDFTYAYAGVLDALKALHELHDAPGGPSRTMAVLTNKPVRPARGICEGLGLADYFLHIYGGDSFPQKKPDPFGLRSLMEETGSTPEETVMIGDSQVDVRDRAQRRSVVARLRRSASARKTLWILLPTSSSTLPRSGPGR